MEVSPDTNLYTNGNGLIKLADLSGWAIVPHQHDIELAENGHRTTAYEEIGNALLPATQPNQMEDVASARLLRDVVWLRVVAPRNGAKVLLPPPRHQSSSTYGQRNNKVSHAAPPKASTSYDSETTSSFMDSVWNKITPSKGRETDHVLCDQTPVIPVIPCGMVVPVEPWEQSENSIVSYLHFISSRGPLYSYSHASSLEFLSLVQWPRLDS
jgi:hypothetical protein